MSKENKEIYMSDWMYLPISFKGVQKQEPKFRGKGEHSINELETICEQFKEYCYQQSIIKNNAMKHLVELKFSSDEKEENT